MVEFSEYEDGMISFLMGYGMSEDGARAEVIERRADLFGDDSHAITKEELDAQLLDVCLADEVDYARAEELLRLGAGKICETP